MALTPFAAFLAQMPKWRAYLLALLAGGCLPFSLAPFNLWPIAIIGIALLALLIADQRPTQTFIRSFFFGLGFYGIGVSWIFVSIHFYGGASALLAGLLTLIFVSFIALIFALPFVVFSRYFKASAVKLLLVFPLIWMLGEWLRSWLLTGFPWLYVGYGHLDTWLAGWAPIAGVFGISLIVAATGALLAQVLRSRPDRTMTVATSIMVLFWLGGIALQKVNWTLLDTQPITVALVQPDIAQDIKWDTDHVEPTLELLIDLSEQLWHHDWLVWPEAAVPLTYHQALPFLNELNQQADATQTGLITGIIYDDLQARRYYNSVASFGTALGIYHKRRLVPFGEYVPLEDWLRGLIHFFDLPTSIINRGPQEQHGIRIGEINVSPAVCYELVYPDLMARSARSAQILLSVSNLGWFGDSLGPPQFLQMGQMRALETGRYLVYSTNNGPSALVNHRGQIIQQTEAFSIQTLSGEVFSAEGITPFMRWGSWPLALLAFLIGGVVLLVQARRQLVLPPH